MVDRIVDKIRKLNQHAESAKEIGSEAEAQAFASMVQKMLLEHNLTMADVAAKAPGQKAEEAVREYFRPREHGVTESRVRVSWQEDLAFTVAFANFCEILVHRGTNMISFIGLKHNVEVAIYSYAVLVRSADNLADQAYGKFWKECAAAGDVTLCRGFRASFLNGFITRLLKRIKEQRTKDEQTVSASGITALAVIDKSLQAINDYKSKLTIHNVDSTQRRNTNYEGHRRGQQAADDVQLNKGLNDKGSSPRGELR